MQHLVLFTSSFYVGVVNRFNLIQTVGGKINWNCNGGHVRQDLVCFGAYHFQQASVAVASTELCRNTTITIWI